MNAALWQMAEDIRNALPGIVRREKCGKAVKLQVVQECIYMELVKKLGADELPSSITNNAIERNTEPTSEPDT